MSDYPGPLPVALGQCRTRGCRNSAYTRDMLYYCCKPRHCAACGSGLATEQTTDTCPQCADARAQERYNAQGAK